MERKLEDSDLEFPNVTKRIVKLKRNSVRRSIYRLKSTIFPESIKKLMLLLAVVLVIIIVVVITVI